MALLALYFQGFNYRPFSSNQRYQSVATVNNLLSQSHTDCAKESC